MEGDNRTEQLVASLLRTLSGELPRKLQIERTPLTGGLESVAVERLMAHYRDRGGAHRSFTLIAKQLDGRTAREATVYRHIIADANVSLAPALLNVEEHPPDRIALYLEDVPLESTWPWRDTRASRALLERLARFHELSDWRREVLPEWDYEEELQSSALSTLEQLEGLRMHPELASLARRAIRPVHRFVAALPKRRAELLEFPPFRTGFIHGDLHPGNALIRRCDGRHEPVLIDWARARTGSALEDVSSWLQSLGYWEPEARRRHDTLLGHYLSARGYARRPSSDMRAAYWVASASNALAGALRYYCWKATTCEHAAGRGAAAHTARDWLRVIVRADALAN